RENGGRFVCYVIGEGPLRPALQRQVAALDLAEQVKFVGSRPHAELPTWFRAADVFVLSSHSEGVPNVLLEACACGTRFVATNVGGIPEIADRGCGMLVAPGDPQALARAIDQSLKTAPAPDDNATRAARGHETAADEVIDFGDEILTRRRIDSDRAATAGTAGTAGVASDAAFVCAPSLRHASSVSRGQ